VDRVVPWGEALSRTPSGTARATGAAMAALARSFDELDADVVLVVGDRVEPFAAAAAGHLSGRVVAHVHGGDRAAGQADDSLRHAITKLAHVHFPATPQSEARLLKLGEDRWRIHRVGSPGIDGIRADAAARTAVHDAVGSLTPRRYALLVLHPVDADERAEFRRARLVANAVSAVPYRQVVVIHPNNDPGSGGIVRAWEGLSENGPFIVHRDLPRPTFLGLLRDAAVLVGNSSSGIIEAASFGTPVVDVGPRQRGREHGGNVVHVPYRAADITRALHAAWNGGSPLRSRGRNPYGGSGTGRRIAQILAGLDVDDRLLRKLIAY
jgi:UDP-N-acetylglucosamine 2-epimerase (non-hydrolysing)/GDP/UDP-N,N'-diacetylbacillosamine 2-epimerase (hydrolysing)